MLSHLSLFSINLDWCRADNLPSFLNQSGMTLFRSVTDAKLQVRAKVDRTNHKQNALHLLHIVGIITESLQETFLDLTRFLYLQGNILFFLCKRFGILTHYKLHQLFTDSLFIITGFHKG